MSGGVRTLAFFGLAVLAVAGCGAEEASEAEPPTEAPAEVDSGPSVVRGFLVLGEEVRSIKPCGEDRELWVVPITEATAAYAALAREPSGPVFVEVEGTIGAAPESGPGERFENELRITGLRRAAPATESRGCEEDLSGVAFRASGVEPFWALEITPGAIVYTTPELPRTVFEGARPAMVSGGWVYESVAAGPEPLRLRVVLEPGRCSDSMVGAIYAWTATVEIGGETRTGCAWEGALAPG
jgi:putative lipoprotein